MPNLITKDSLIFLFVTVFLGCGSVNDNNKDSSLEESKEIPSLFKSLSPDSTGVIFLNEIVQDMSLNIYNFEYLYNGGGVAVGDINNDGLADLYFTASVGNDQLFINEGNLKFKNITSSAGIMGQSGVKSGVSMVDINQDGLLDIYVCRTGLKDKKEQLNNLLYINNGDNTFKESAIEYGLKDESNSTQAYFFDYDIDGDLDLYLVNHRTDFKNSTRLRLRQLPDGMVERITEPQTPFESDRLFRNNGNFSFTDVTESAGIGNSSFGLSASIADFNNDGYPDIFVANDYVDPDFCYINNQDGTFTDEVNNYFRHTSQSSMGSDVADFNNDGYLDLFVADMASQFNYRHKSLLNVMRYDRYATLERYGFGLQLGRNVFQLNNGNGNFSEIGELAGVSRTDWSWSPFFADLNNDGKEDLFISNGYRFEVTNNDYLNFTLDSLNKYVGLSSPEKLAIFLDNIPSAKLSNYAFENKGEIRFENSTQKWGLDEPSFSAGAIYGDLDNDGDLDLIVNQIDQPASIYENQSNNILGHNYLQLVFEGPNENKFGIGARVEVVSGGEKQLKELYTSRGFVSSTSHVLHFGLGNNKEIEEINVRWNDGKEQKLNDIEPNQVLTLNYKDARNYTPKNEIINPSFRRTYDQFNDFVHTESEFIDFKTEPLIPHFLSCEGPMLAIADINNDGLDDIFIGGAGSDSKIGNPGQPGSIYIQKNNGNFEISIQNDLVKDQDFEDLDAEFLDVDGDGDSDLYVVSGSNEFPLGSSLYQDRLYLNDGAGNFIRNRSAIPKEVISGGNIATADFDNDGDIDIFLGGKLLPGSYPKSPKSTLLENEGGSFKDVSNQYLPSDWRAQMVYDASWLDIDQNGYQDLIVVGEWMPITIFYNSGNRFEKVELANTEGWWRCIESIDFDKDGDMDFVVGNLGLNTRLKASQDEPLSVYYDDFDSNGSLDAIISYYSQGVEYPLVQKDLLLSQLPSLKKKFVRANDYAKATINDVYSPEKLNNASKKEAFLFESCLVENLGEGKFKILPLPEEAQVAPIRDILAYDYDKDGLDDLLLIGNSFQTEVETGLYDAFNGLVLKNNNGQYHPVDHKLSGFFAPGDGRNIDVLRKGDGTEILICTFNNDKVKTFLNTETISEKAFP